VTSKAKAVRAHADVPDEAALGAAFAEAAAGFATTTVSYSDEQLQAYIAVQGEFNRTAPDLTPFLVAAQ
jgi:hypothetical protein